VQTRTRIGPISRASPRPLPLGTRSSTAIPCVFFGQRGPPAQPTDDPSGPARTPNLGQSHSFIVRDYIIREVHFQLTLMRSGRVTNTCSPTASGLVAGPVHAVGRTARPQELTRAPSAGSTHRQGRLSPNERPRTTGRARPLSPAYAVSSACRPAQWISPIPLLCRSAIHGSSQSATSLDHAHWIE
jgi:hypothetical protein